MKQLTEANLLENGFKFNRKYQFFKKDNISIGRDLIKWDPIKSEGKYKLCIWIGSIWFELNTVEQLHDVFRLIGRNDLVDNWKIGNHRFYPDRVYTVRVKDRNFYECYHSLTDALYVAQTFGIKCSLNLDHAYLNEGRAATNISVTLN